MKPIPEANSQNLFYSAIARFSEPMIFKFESEFSFEPDAVENIRIHLNTLSLHAVYRNRSYKYLESRFIMYSTLQKKRLFVSPYNFAGSNSLHVQ